MNTANHPVVRRLPPLPPPSPPPVTLPRRPDGRSYDDIRKSWHAANLRPLWESMAAHRVREGGPAPTHWKWKQIRPLVDDAVKVASPAAIERRVLTFADPNADAETGGTTTNLTTALQILLPGEKARPHRHTMNALRFVIEGSGASTIVDGKDCPMAEGDLVITPGWTWHEHVHRGSAPIIWLDALDAPLHRYLGTDAFEPGPAHDCRPYRTMPPSRFPTSCPSSATGAIVLAGVPLSVDGGAQTRCAPRRNGRTARGGSGTSIRSPADRPCR